MAIPDVTMSSRMSSNPDYTHQDISTTELRVQVSKIANDVYTAESFAEIYRSFEELRDHGFEFLGWGRDRYVFREGNEVLKIAKPEIVTDRLSAVPPHGKESNRCEAGIWERTQHPLLAPVTDFHKSHLWIRQQYAHPPEPGDVEYLFSKLEESEELGVAITDIDTRNIGRIDGEPVIYDYAMGHDTLHPYQSDFSEFSTQEPDSTGR